MQTTRNRAMLTKALAISLILSVAALSVAPTANAGTADNFQVTISKADLTTKAGIARIHTQLSKATKKACRHQGGHTPLSDRVASKKCYAENMEKFVKQINDDRLFAYDDRKTKRTG